MSNVVELRTHFSAVILNHFALQALQRYTVCDDKILNVSLSLCFLFICVVHRFLEHE